jgi:hypothetical protein
MTDLSRERCKALAEKNGWSLARAEGFLEGESYRRRALTPSNYVRVGIDEYCLGFRSGYYERNVRNVASPARPVPQLKVRDEPGRS